MKKSLLTMALLGSLVSAATAQSSVTVYGIIDMAVSKANNGQSNLSYFSDWQVGKTDQLTIHSASSSRLGFRGSEDLGGGMKANFLMELRFQPDTGSIEPRDGVTFTGGARTYNQGFWNAQSYVGLSGNFGEIRLGRNATPHFTIGLASDPWAYEYNVAGFAGFTRGGNQVATTNNSINYLSPNFSGLTAQIGLGLAEGGTSAAATAAPNGRNVGLAIQYRQGPLWAAFGYNNSKRPDAILNRATILALTYDFGVIKPILNYSVGKNSVAGNPSTKTMLIGAHIPAGSGYIRTAVGRYDPAVGFNMNTVNPGATAASTPNPYAAYPVTRGQTSTKFAIGYVYNLSKRTSVSVDVGTNKTQTYSRSSGYQAAIRHTF
ncbi:MAG: porin [Pseudomonadota bacterium]